MDVKIRHKLIEIEDHVSDRFVNNNNNNNNNNISLFREDNILSIAYPMYDPLQVQTIQLFTNKL